MSFKSFRGSHTQGNVLHGLIWQILMLDAVIWLALHVIIAI